SQSCHTAGGQATRRCCQAARGRARAMATRERPPFAALLRRYRLAASLTQEALAERAHLSAVTVGALERGVNHTPRQDTLDLLAEALGLSSQDRVAFAAAARRQDGPVPR